MKPIRMIIALSSLLLLCLALYIALLPSFFPLRVRLLYEGAGDTSPELGPYCRNWFFRGEVARLEFEVRNPYFRDVEVEVSLAPFDDPSSRSKIYDFRAERSQLVLPSVTTRSMEVETNALNPSLYEVQVYIEGTSKYVAPTAPTSNIESYPWMLCVMERLNSSAVERSVGMPELTVPYGLGVNIHFTRPSPSQEVDLDMIRNAGFKLIRMDFAWDSVEKRQGLYDFQDYRVLTEGLERRGIRPLYILDYGNPLYDGGLAPHTDVGRRAFALFASASVKGFENCDVIWEIWNEPNGGFWNPSPNVIDYTRLAIEATKSMREAQGNCTIIAPATSGVDADFIDATKRMGLLPYLSAISVHPYRDTAPETAIPEYVNLRKIIGNMTLVSGEWGYTTSGSYGNRVDVITQAKYTVRIYLTNLMKGVPISIIYDWKDDGLSLQDSEQNFGLMADHDESKQLLGFECFYIKPSYYAMYNLIRELYGYTPLRAQDVGAGTYALWFARDDARKLVLWTQGGRGKLELGLNSTRIELVRMFGTKEEIVSGNGTFRLAVDDSPIIITPKD
jgi:hypothetical protein